MPLLPRLILGMEEKEEVFFTRKPKAVIIFPSTLIRMNESLKWSACQSEKTWLQSEPKNTVHVAVINCVGYHSWKAGATEEACLASGF